MLRGISAENDLGKKKNDGGGRFSHMSQYSINIGGTKSQISSIVHMEEISNSSGINRPEQVQYKVQKKKSFTVGTSQSTKNFKAKKQSNSGKPGNQDIVM